MIHSQVEIWLAVKQEKGSRYILQAQTEVRRAECERAVYFIPISNCCD